MRIGRFVCQILAVSALLILLVGCHSPKRAFQPPVNPNEMGDVEFLHYLATAPTVTMDEGVRAVLMTAGETQQWPTFEARVAELARRGAIEPSWAGDADETLTMGTLGYMLAAVCDVPSGVNLRVSELTGVGRRRYALRACVDAELVPYATPRQPVRGGELVAAVTRCSERTQSEPRP